MDKPKSQTTSPKPTAAAETDDDVARRLEVYLARWRRRAQMWNVVLYAVGGVAIVAPILVASAGDLFSEDSRLPTILAVLASVAAAIMTFAKPGQSGFGFVQAHHKLELALLRYRHHETDRGRTGPLLDAFGESRRLIFEVHPSRLTGDGREMPPEGDEGIGDDRPRRPEAPAEIVALPNGNGSGRAEDGATQPRM